MSEQWYEGQRLVLYERNQAGYILPPSTCASGRSAKKCSDDSQQIVPVSVSCELTEITAANQDVDIDRAISPAIVQDDVKNIMIRKDGIEIELPQKTSEEMILALLRGLRKC